MAKLTEEGMERVKENALLLADEHRKSCDNPTCNISLSLLGVLLDAAGIGVTHEEAKRLW